jgi:hypothetical protein
VLAVLVAVVLASPVGALSAGLVAVATSLRWGTAWLVPLGGAQAVLGSAVLVGPVSGAAASALGAAALLLAAPPPPAAAAALGTTAALLVAGPAGASGVVVRLLATVVGVGLAHGAGRLGRLRLRTLAALVLAAAALGLAAV